MKLAKLAEEKVMLSIINVYHVKINTNLILIMQEIVLNYVIIIGI
jgi:hypothetical protein